MRKKAKEDLRDQMLNSQSRKLRGQEYGSSVECLPSKHEALNAPPSIPLIKKEVGARHQWLTVAILAT
jgi:hypothetical protein